MEQPNVRRLGMEASGEYAHSSLSDVYSHRRSLRKSKVAEDPVSHGAMLCPVVGGADKTTVSVATGQTEYHPVYVSAGNIANSMRRAHRETVMPAAFLAIPKGTE